MSDEERLCMAHGIWIGIAVVEFFWLLTKFA
jgi:hypothetical protein